MLNKALGTAGGKVYVTMSLSCSQSIDRSNIPFGSAWAGNGVLNEHQLMVPYHLACKCLTPKGMDRLVQVVSLNTVQATVITPHMWQLSSKD